MNSPQVVVHLEMPRGLSLTVKPWRQALCKKLNAIDIEYIQRDLNTGFWRWLLDDFQSGLFENFINIDYQSSSYNNFSIQKTADLIASYATNQFLVALSGVQFCTDISGSTEKLFQHVEQNIFGPFFHEWLDAVVLDCSAAQVISFSVGSPDELVIASMLSAHFRRHMPEKQCVLTYHRWENYTLKPFLHDLVFNGQLLELFDAVVTREDKAGEALSSLCMTLRTGDVRHLSYLCAVVDDQPRWFEQGDICIAELDSENLNIRPTEQSAIADYLRSLNVPTSKILMIESFVQNDCHYGKCTFCVQNLGYHQHQQFKHKDQLARSIPLIEHLSKHHDVQNFTFVDQALAGPLVKRICKELEEKSLGIEWCCRMLPENAYLEQDVLNLMAAVGCKEILVGLESVLPSTLEAMGKHKDFKKEKTIEWIERCNKAGIDVTLSTIRGFPTETEEEFQQGTADFLYSCLDRFNNVNVIVNVFNLFRGSPMAEDPEKYGIKETDDDHSDLMWTIDYEDQHGRSYYSNVESLSPIIDTDEDILYVHYSSIGLLYHWRTGKSLLEHGNTQADDELLETDIKRFADRDELVLGSESYLGMNLAGCLDHSKIILSSKRLCSSEYINVPYLTADLCSAEAKLSTVRPSIVWICARPIDDDFDVLQQFNVGIKKLLIEWAELGCLQKVVFFSTQLVMKTPENGCEGSGADVLKPEAPYDYAKAELELFLEYLSARYQFQVEVVRLPLLWGGISRQEHRNNQLLYQWKNRLNNGESWNLSDESNSFGNSWVDIADLVKHLSTESDNQTGFRCRTVKSGDFTYAKLQENWYRSSESKTDGFKSSFMHLYKTEFFLTDELNLPSRDIFDV